jgi:hypothetical protein
MVCAENVSAEQCRDYDEDERVVIREMGWVTISLCFVNEMHPSQRRGL